jgi:hypothetical protein
MFSQHSTTPSRTGDHGMSTIDPGRIGEVIEACADNLDRLHRERLRPVGAPPLAERESGKHFGTNLHREGAMKTQREELEDMAMKFLFGPWIETTDEYSEASAIADLMEEVLKRFGGKA